MRTRIYLAAISAVAVLSTGCASITGSSTQNVSVKTSDATGLEVIGAACELSNDRGKWSVTTPGSLIVQRSNDDMQVLCNKTGLETGRASVVSNTKGAMYGNILFGGPIGAVMDHKTGAAYDYPSLLAIIMGRTTKIEMPKPAEPAVTASGTQ